MGFLTTVLGLVGFSIGIPIGLLFGYFLFICYLSDDVKDPLIRPLLELDTSAIHDLLPEIPFWVKNPDYERVDWLNTFVSDMWPYLSKGLCSIIPGMVEPIFTEYMGKFPIKSIQFEKLSLGTLPPVVHGVKIHETNERDLIIEPAIKFAGNPDILLALKLFNLRISIQLTDLQIFIEPRIILKPLVPTFPCFANVIVSLMNKPRVDFGMKILGGDVMAIPGVYRLIQERIKRHISELYLWPQSLLVPILDSSLAIVRKPVGILHVNIVRAFKLLKMDFFGASDPYVQLSLSGERLPAKKTTVKRRNLNPEWNENFKFAVRYPSSQVLQLYVYDWDKVGGNDRLGMQVVPLKSLIPNETREFTLDLLKNTNANDPQNNKRRGRLVVELTFVPFREDAERFSGSLDEYSRRQSVIDRELNSSFPRGAGLLMVTIHGAEDVEGERHNNPFALILFRGERKKTKLMKKTRDPIWNEEFQYMLEEPPVGEKVRIEVKSKRTGIGFRSKESLGRADINLTDVVHNGRINQKYHLINSKNGKIHLEIRWKTV